MSKVEFSKALSSYDEYLNFMKGKEHISKLRGVAISNENNLVVKYPYLKTVSSIFKNTIKSIINAQLASLTSLYYGGSQHNLYGYKSIKSIGDLVNAIKFGNNYLVPSINEVLPAYRNISIDLAGVDKKIKETLLIEDRNKNSLQTNESEGICRGMSIWFDFLYMSTKEMFKDKSSEIHIKAVADIFKDGSPIEGYLIQKIDSLPIQKASYSEAGYAQKFVDPFSKMKETQNVLKQLPIGNYGLLIHKHEANLIKVSKDCMYLWDPNIGLVKIEDTNVEKAFLNTFKKGLYRKDTKNDFVLFKRSLNGEKNSPNVTEVKPGIFIFQGSRLKDSIPKLKHSKPRYLFVKQILFHLFSPVLLPLFFLMFCFKKKTSFISIIKKTFSYYKSKNPINMYYRTSLSEVRRYQSEVQSELSYITAMRRAVMCGSEV